MSEGLPVERVVIQYDSTFEEAVEDHLRAVNRLNLVRNDVWKGTLALAVLVAVFVFLALSFRPGRYPLSIPAKLGWSGFGIVLAVLIFPRLYQWSAEQRVRRVLRELRGSENPVPFQVELTASGVSIKLGGVQSIFDWASILRVEDTPDAIDFIAGNGGFVAVSKRAFASSEAAREFLQLAERYLARAGTSQSSGSND